MKQLKKNDTLPKGGKQLNDSRVLIRNHGSYRGVAQFFSDFEIKELLTQKLTASENKISFRSEGEIWIFSDEGKLGEFAS